jgi:hypothetical protein
LKDFKKKSEEEGGHLREDVDGGEEALECLTWKTMDE